MSKAVARQLRASSPPPERAMWAILFGLRKAGYHFRRQTQIGPYYADFAELDCKLVIEVDGGTHGTDAAHAYDDERNAYMTARGFTVLRFWNNDVLENPDGVYAVILGALGLGETPHPVPPPQGGRRRSRRRVVGEASAESLGNAATINRADEAERFGASPPPLRASRPVAKAMQRAGGTFQGKKAMRAMLEWQGRVGGGQGQ